MTLEIFLGKNMAKKRSKKDRIRASLHRSAKITPISTAWLKTESKPTKGKDDKNYLEEIFAYSPTLIVGDLKKTFFVVLFILVVLLTISLLYT